MTFPSLITRGSPLLLSERRRGTSTVIVIVIVIVIMIMIVIGVPESGF